MAKPTGKGKKGAASGFAALQSDEEAEALAEPEEDEEEAAPVAKPSKQNKKKGKKVSKRGMLLPPVSLAASPWPP